MSENRENEARSWNDEETHGDKAVADLKRSMDRLRGHIGTYRDQMSDNDDDGFNETDGTPEGEGSEA